MELYRPQKIKSITVRVTQEEYDDIVRKTNKEKKRLSDLIRDALLKSGESKNDSKNN